MASENVKLVVDNFGTVVDHITKKQEHVKRFTWTNQSNISVQVQFEMI
jgi:uncharacterized protein YjdB